MAEARTGGQVHLRQEGAVAVITLDNPPVNSSTDAVRRGILAALGRIDVQRTTAVVLTGRASTWWPAPICTSWKTSRPNRRCRK
ncbi:hypothetical protein [Billgrantia tianxiuensis]|uniref:hypothetical protein n=1 Tax=Billgrantia tianxiuensis TaxID=2497861 RepID=UPI0019154CBE|nr:hypothetical protein [Halomonas tianxiuensis]